MDEDDPWLRHPWEDADSAARQGHRGTPNGPRPGRGRPAGAVRGGWLPRALRPGRASHDLALRDANLTGSYTLAALTGRLREAAPWRGQPTAGEGRSPSGDHPVADALAYGRHGRRLAELATWRRRAASGNCREAPAHGCRPPARSPLREPLVTGRAGLVSSRLVDTSVLREMTGRAAWRAFAIM